MVAIIFIGVRKNAALSVDAILYNKVLMELNVECLESHFQV